jgi:hypothetical protein
LRTPVGDPIYVRMKAEKCVAIPAPAAAPSVAADPAAVSATAALASAALASSGTPG